MKWKHLVVTLVLILVMLMSMGCYTGEGFVKDLGGTEFNLVALKDVKGTMGEFYPGFLGSGGGELYPGVGIVFAIKLKDNSIVILSMNTEKVRIIYEDVLPYVELRPVRFSDIAPWKARRWAKAALIKEMVREYNIHIPQGSVNDFLGGW